MLEVSCSIILRTIFSYVCSPWVDNMIFKFLNMVDEGDLVKPFSLVEVKQAVWNYDSFKSPWLDGMNLGFIKDLRWSCKMI